MNMTWYDMMRYDMTWYDMIWCEVIWYSIISSDDLSLNTYSLTYFYNMHTLIWCTSSKGNLLNSYSETFQISPECSRRISEYFTLYHSIFISSLPSAPSLLFILILHFTYLNRFNFQSPKVEGDEWRKASTDVVIAGLGWISITGKYIRCRLCHGCMLGSCVCGLIFVCVCVNVNAVFTSVLGFSLMMTL